MVAQPHLPHVRALQGWGGIDVERLEGGVISLCGACGVCEAMKTGFLLPGLRINLNQRVHLAGFITPSVAIWDRSGPILLSSFCVFRFSPGSCGLFEIIQNCSYQVPDSQVATEPQVRGDRMRTHSCESAVDSKDPSCLEHHIQSIAISNR